jgi:thiol-disulfide isomerase/thioredoxin
MFIKHLSFLSLFFSFSNCYNKVEIKTDKIGKVMPSFNLLLMDNTSQFNTKAIPKGQPIVFFYFTPKCPFCRAQTREIIADLKSHNNIQFYFFSSFPFKQIKSYYDYYQLNKYPNIIVGQDYGSFFENYFEVQSVPYFAIYSTDKRLKQVLVGKFPTNKIKQIAIN